MNWVYPNTRIDEVTDTLAGVSFADPYRWLEGDSEEVHQWQQAQADLASTHIRSWPQFHRLQELVARYSTERPERSGGMPRYAGGRWFRTRLVEGASQAQVIVAEEPMGDGRVLFDPIDENPGCPPYISWISPSPDGCTLALGVCMDGSENNTIRLIDVSTGQVLACPPTQTLMDNWTGGVQWLPDSRGFFFSSIQGSAVEFEQQVYLHRRSPAPNTEKVVVGWTRAKDYRMVAVSQDGGYAVALEGLTNLLPVSVAKLGGDSLVWRPFITSVVGTVAGHVVGDQFIAVTDVAAPRGRLVSIALHAEDPNNPQCWRELVAESDATMRIVTPVGTALYLSEYVDTYSRVRTVSFDGEVLGEVPLPGRGAVGELPFSMSNLISKGHPQEFLFSFSSFTVSPGIFRHVPGQENIETLQEPRVRLDHTIVEDHWAVSPDGTRIPYHLVRRTAVDAHCPQPTLIYAYGGFNALHAPQFPGLPWPIAAFIAAGGVLVHAHLRGGGEFGLEWWEGGRMGSKQNCYQDLYAVAEDLIAANRCTPQMLAVTGGSNGGLMAGVAATQRPDLWKVVVARVPWLDLIGTCRDLYGRMCVMMELANVEDPSEVRRLATFSPYHLVRDGVSYPAVFLDAGNSDPRCPPWHARKFAARLQRATKGAAPILLHVWENVGHGWATDKTIALNQNTEWIAFTMQHLGLDNWEC